MKTRDEYQSKTLLEDAGHKKRLAQFKQRYKQFPEAGMKVDVVTDDNGYWKIVFFTASRIFNRTVFIGISSGTRFCTIRVSTQSLAEAYIGESVEHAG